MPNYPAERAVAVLLRIVGKDEFEKREVQEQRAILGALAQINHPLGIDYFSSLFGQKGGVFGRKKVDERKIFVIDTLSQVSSIQVFQFLAAQAQNLETNSKDVAEACRIAALAMRERLAGGRKV
jgi:ERCC4-type nuclease